MRFPIGILRVKDKSMEPMLHEDDYVIVSYFYKKPKVGDIVILSHPKLGIKIVKRISRIKSGRVFVVGENELSSDSRLFGYVNLRDIIGKVLFRV